MIEPKIRFKQEDGKDYPSIQALPFGDIVKQYTEKTESENEDVLLSCAIDGIFLNTELFGHQRGASNIGYKKIRRNTLILSAQNLHLGNANVNQRFDHGIISPAYNTYDIVGCNPDFMAQWVKRDATKGFFYNATTTGASQCRRNVDWIALYQQAFYMPCEEEQRRIAGFLSSVDDVIAASEQEVTNLEKQKKAVMKKIFSQEVRFKRPDGSEFPEWEESTIEDTCECLDSMRKPITKGDRESGPYPYYGSTNIQDYVAGYLFDESLVLLAEDAGPFMEYWEKPIAQWAEGKFWVNNHAHVLRPLGNRKFMFYQLEHKDIREFINNPGRGKLNQEDMRKIVVSVPSIEEQQLIATFFSNFDGAIAAAKQELEKWKELKKGLLQQMFV